MEHLANATPQQVRQLIRRNELVRPTAGLCQGHVQANLAVVPKDLAYDFLLFCQRNPKPCPILDVTDVGSPEPRLLGPGADLRYDIPKYRVWKNGELADEPTDVARYWRDDLVAFLIGCSFTFETALLKAMVPVRHIEEECNVPMYLTDIACHGDLHHIVDKQKHSADNHNCLHCCHPVTSCHLFYSPVLRCICRNDLLGIVFHRYIFI